MDLESRLTKNNFIQALIIGSFTIVSGFVASVLSKNIFYKKSEKENRYSNNNYSSTTIFVSGIIMFVLMMLYGSRDKELDS